MGRFAEAAGQAANITNQELATEIASVSVLSRSKIEQLLPNKRDKEAFVSEDEFGNGGQSGAQGIECTRVASRGTVAHRSSPASPVSADSWRVADRHARQRR
jgi:hypothetical protein